MLPFARRDLERLRLVLTAQRRLRDVLAPASARRMLAARSYFEEAVRWLEIHGGPGAGEAVAHWGALDVEPRPHPALPQAHADRDDVATGTGEGEGATRRPRRRRRRRGPRGEPTPPA